MIGAWVKFCKVQRIAVFDQFDCRRLVVSTILKNMKVNGQDYSQYVEKNVRNHKPDRIFSIWTHAHTLPKANGRDIPIPRPASEMGGFCMLHQ
jgi:hypothetical protein